MVTACLLILPELYQSILIGILLFKSLTYHNQYNGHDSEIKYYNWISYAALLGVILTFLSLGNNDLLFLGAYRLDTLSQFFKLIISIGFAISVFNARNISVIKHGYKFDYFMFLGLSSLGLMLLSSSVELITIYLALEISSYSLYAIIPLRDQEQKAAEAGIKYILFGAAATALSLYGLSYILATQNSSYIEILVNKSWNWADAPLALVGLTLFLVSLFYKLALFPFHFWCPDVYDGTSNETAAFAATLPKLGAIVILIRLVSQLQPAPELITIISILCAISITFGNLSALVQDDVKRLLGYSSIAHAGYILIGLISCSAQGVAATSFYSLVYVIMNFSCFWVVCRLSGSKNVKLNDLNGLYRRSPSLAFTLAVGAFALVGIPPTAGFIGKLFLLASSWDRGYNWLIILAAVNTAISIYYYLNLVRHAYTEEENSITPLKPLTGRIFGGILAVVLLILGTLPAPVISLAEKASRQLLLP